MKQGGMEERYLRSRLGFLLNGLRACDREGMDTKVGLGWTGTPPMTNAVLGQALCTLLDPGHTEAVVEYTRLGHDRDTVAPAFHRHIEWTTGPWLCTADGNRVYVVAETAPSAHTLLHLEKARGRLGTQDLSCLVRPRGGLCNEDPRKDGPP